MKIAVLYFGNELIPEDRFAIEVVEEMKKKSAKIDFIHCKSPEEILNCKNYEKIFILDVSPNVNDVMFVEDTEMLKKRKLFSLHDFDLNFFLKLVEKLGSVKIKNTKIIALPINGKREALAEKALGIILQV